MAPSLRNHPTGQREIRGAHVIRVIGVVLQWLIMNFGCTAE